MRHLIAPISTAVIGTAVVMVGLNFMLQEIFAVSNSLYEYKCKQENGKVVKPAKYVKDCVDADGKSIKL